MITKTHQQPPISPPLSLSFYNNVNNPVIHGEEASKKKKNVLNPSAVRERSLSVPGCQEIHSCGGGGGKNGTETILNFLVVTPTKNSTAAVAAGTTSLLLSSSSSSSQPARITVFCDTGTIGTARVLDGKIRQKFRRNVDSLDVVERLLTFPEGPAEINEQLIGMNDREDEKGNSVDASINFQKELELADVGLCILEGEREKLTKHFQQLEEIKEEEEENLQNLVIKNHRKHQKQLQLQLQLQQQQHKQHQEQQQQSKVTSSFATGLLQSNLLQQTSIKSNSSRNKSGTITCTNNDNNKESNNNSHNNRTGRRRNKLLNLGSRHRNNNASNHTKSNEPRTKSIAITKGGPAICTSLGKTKPNKGNVSDAGKYREQNIRSSYATGMNANANEKSDTSYNKKVLVPSSMNATATNERGISIDVHEVAAYEFHFKLPADVMKQVDQCLRDIAKMNKIVKGVATNGRGTVFLYGNGGVAYTPSIPKALYHKLRQLRSSSYSSRPCFVALGSRDRFYVGFNDGTADWKGSNVLDKTLKKIITKSNNGTGKRHMKLGGNDSSPSSMLPRSVAFGSTYDTFFIIYHDGSWQYQGRGIPKSLEDKLKERQNRADLLCCNLGPNGEWFLKNESGKMWWSGISSELDDVLKKITSTGYLHNMDFGDNGSYFISYDEE